MAAPISPYVLVALQDNSHIGMVYKFLAASKLHHTTQSPIDLIPSSKISVDIKARKAVGKLMLVQLIIIDHMMKYINHMANILLKAPQQMSTNFRMRHSCWIVQ